jgi:hypothetical protein
MVLFLLWSLVSPLAPKSKANGGPSLHIFMMFLLLTVSTIVYRSLSLSLSLSLSHTVYCPLSLFLLSLSLSLSLSGMHAVKAPQINNQYK